MLEFRLIKLSAFLLNTKINDYLSNGPRILIIYKDDYYKNRSVKIPGIVTSDNLPIYDQFADQTNFNVMERNQFVKLLGNQGNRNRLFLLSWTMTPDTGTFANAEFNPFCSVNSLRDMSFEANPHLAGFVNAYAHLYKMNVLYVDFCNLVDITQLAIYANKLSKYDTVPANPKLKYVTLSTLTHDDDKDGDTNIFVDVWTSDRRTLIAQGNWLNGNVGYGDDPQSCHTIKIPVMANFTKSQCNGFIVDIRSKGNGNDHWIFDGTVGLTFSDNSTLVKTQMNIDLNSGGSITPPVTF